MFPSIKLPVYITTFYVILVRTQNGVEQPICIDDLGVQFDGPIYAIANGRELQQLLVLSDNSLYTLSLSTNPPTIKHIVGSSDAGYREGRGSDALFNYPQGVALYSSTYAVVSDFSNHCLRYVNLNNGQTSIMVGICELFGFQDGDKTSARFNFPWGVVKIGEFPKISIVIADKMNHALRLFDSGVVTTLTAGGDLNHPGHLFYKDDFIFTTIQHGIVQYHMEYNYTTIIGKPFAGTGYSECLDKALFNNPRGVYAWSNSIVIVADFSSNLLKILDLGRNRMRKLWQGVKPMETYFNQTYFSRPNALFIYNEELLIGEHYGRIRKARVSDLIGFVSCPPDISLTIPDGQDGVLFSEGGYNLYLKTGEVTLARTSRSGDFCWQTITITGVSGLESSNGIKSGTGSEICTTTENNIAWLGFGVMVVILTTLIFIILLYTRHVKKAYYIHQEKMESEAQTTKNTISMINKKSKKENSNTSSSKDETNQESGEIIPKLGQIEDSDPGNSSSSKSSPLINEKKNPHERDDIASPAHLTITGLQAKPESVTENQKLPEVSDV